MRFLANKRCYGSYYDQVCDITWEINLSDGKITSIRKNVDGCDGLYQFDDYYFYERGEENFLKKALDCRNFFYNVNQNTYYKVLDLLDEEDRKFFSFES